MSILLPAKDAHMTFCSGEIASYGPPVGRFRRHSAEAPVCYRCTKAHLDHLDVPVQFARQKRAWHRPDSVQHFTYAGFGGDV